MRSANPYEAGIGWSRQGLIPRTVCDKYPHVTLYSIKAQEACERGRSCSFGGTLEKPYTMMQAEATAPALPQAALTGHGGEDETWWQAQLLDGSILGPCRLKAMEPLWRKTLRPESLILSKKLAGWLHLSEVPSVLHHLEARRDREVVS